MTKRSSALLVPLAAILLGFALGCAAFGIIAVAAAYAATMRLAKGMESGDCLCSRPVGAIDRAKTS